MSFMVPERLWLFLVIPIMAVGYVVLQVRRRRYTVRFTNVALIDRLAPRRPGWRRHVAALLVMVSVGFLVVAFAQPQEEVEVPRERATIVLAIDVSLSMNADDVEPTRLEAARSAAVEFVEGLPESFNVSVVSFAGTANILVPPTTERAVVHQAIQGLELDESTAIGEAIYTSLDALNQVPATPESATEPVPARVVLLADGAQNVGRSFEEAAEEAADSGVPIYAIGFGTPYGMVDIEGQTEPVPVDQESMDQVAEISGGQSYTAASQTELQQVYADIDSSIGYVNEEHEITARFVGFALISVLVAGTMSLFFFGRLP